MPEFKLKQEPAEEKKPKVKEIPDRNFHPSQKDLYVLLERDQRPVTDKTDKILSPEKNAPRLKALRKELEEKEQQPPLFKEKC
jgi:hypothetical protein